MYFMSLASQGAQKKVKYRQLIVFSQHPESHEQPRIQVEQIVCFYNIKLYKSDDKNRPYIKTAKHEVIVQRTIQRENLFANLW